MLLRCCAALLLARTAHGFLPSTNPPWPPTYNMSMSTITMACNSSGPFDAALAAQFGIVSFDWSNEKAQWAAAKPMDCEERMAAQVSRVKQINPAAKVFGYRNLVKALPWFSTVRAKLEDARYAGFFLAFNGSAPGAYHVPDCAPEDAAKCSALYHDQEQTPAVPTADDPAPDGACTAGVCDCGAGVPCGEYLWDFRNGSALVDFLVGEHLLGAAGLGSPDMDGLFIDDFWCSDRLNGTCSDPVQGPTEVDAHNQADMGLADADVDALTAGWLDAFTAAQAAILAAGKWTWSLAPGQANANAMPTLLPAAADGCAATVRPACAGGAAAPLWRDGPLLFGLTPGETDATSLPQLDADLAAFLLMRGPYAYAGWGVWGMSWPAGVAFTGDDDAPARARPAALDADYGAPVDDACREEAPGVFSRAWSKAHVRLDCNAFVANITWV